MNSNARAAFANLFSTIRAAFLDHERAETELKDVCRRRPRMNSVAAYPYCASGFCQRKPRNRAKSPSVEHNVSPCSIASVAR
jgi:hypothetical protein